MLSLKRLVYSLIKTLLTSSSFLRLLDGKSAIPFVLLPHTGYLWTAQSVSICVKGLGRRLGRVWQAMAKGGMVSGHQKDLDPSPNQRTRTPDISRPRRSSPTVQDEYAPQPLMHGRRQPCRPASYSSLLRLPVMIPTWSHMRLISYRVLGQSKIPIYSPGATDTTTIRAYGAEIDHLSKPLLALPPESLSDDRYLVASIRIVSPAAEH